MKLSILISSYNRINLFRRCLYSIRANLVDFCYEVIVADDGSTDDTLGLVREQLKGIPWKFIRTDIKEWEQKTGIKKYHNNPSFTNNVAFRHSTGDLIALMGNEIIAVPPVFHYLLKDRPKADNWIVYSTTYDLPQLSLDKLDNVGSNLSVEHIREAMQYPLQSKGYRSDVTNYLSLCPRSVWEQTGGYDERYLGGVACEDSDFSRRARAIPGFQAVVSDGVSLHQFHGGVNLYYNHLDKKWWDDGVVINRKIYSEWNGKPENPCPFPVGECGIKEIITND